MLPEFFSLFPF